MGLDSFKDQLLIVLIERIAQLEGAQPGAAVVVPVKVVDGTGGSLLFMETRPHAEGGPAFVFHVERGTAAAELGAAAALMAARSQGNA